MGPNHHPKYYRPEIDGLRAIAVVGVVLFHAGIQGIPGGYVGVDVFFVISGFLITQIMLRDISARRFSYGQFYERRVRRILPALFAVMAAVTLLSLVLLPNDLKQFSKSLAAVPLFVSNVLFWLGPDYFSGDVDTMPLLHTWSLAIEEQFYIAFPACLLLLARFGRRAVVAAVLCLLAASLALCIEETLRSSKSGFYMPYARAWELMIGALLATGIVGAPHNKAVAEILSLCGLALIAAAMILFNTSTLFPGYAALAPCMGTALVLYGTQTGGTMAGRLLGAKGPKAIGAISYSLYLWHWPLIVFAGYYVLDLTVLPYAKMAAAALSLPLAFLSWRYIEQPFRGSRGLFTRQKLFAASAVMSGIFVALGVAGWITNGLPGRFPAFVTEITEKRYNDNADCNAARHCIIGATGVAPSFAILGDSHAHALNNGLDSLARRIGVSGYALYNLGCRPFLDAIVSAACRDKNRTAMQIIQEHRLRAVFITAEWSTGTTAKTTAALEGSLQQTVTAAAKNGAAVYVMLDVPAALRQVPETLAKYRLLGLPSASLQPTVAGYTQSNARFVAAARDLEKHGQLHILDPQPLFCARTACAIAQGNVPFYIDAAHLNAFGAERVSVLFADILKPPPP